MTNTDEIREFFEEVIRHVTWYHKNHFYERLDALLEENTQGWRRVDEELPEEGVTHIYPNTLP